MFLIIIFCQWGESGAAAFPSDPSRCVSMWTGADRWSPEGFPSRSDQISVFKSFLSIWARRISSVDHQQITADPCWLFCLSQAGPSRRWVRATLRRTSDTFPPAGTETVWFLRSVGLHRGLLPWRWAGSCSWWSSCWSSPTVSRNVWTFPPAATVRPEQTRSSNSSLKYQNYSCCSFS